GQSSDAPPQATPPTAAAPPTAASSAAPPPPPAATPPLPPPVSGQTAPPVDFATVAAPARRVLARLDPTGWRPTGIVLGIILALVFGTQLLNAALPARTGTGPDPQPQPGTPIDVGQGVRVYPQAGWSADTSVADQVRLQKGSAVVDVFVFAGFQGDASALLSSYVEQRLRPGAGQLAVSGSQAIPVTAGSPGVRATYVGNFTGVQQAIEGELTAISLGGRAILFDGWANQGQLGPALDEVHLMAQTVEVR
ncbi:MAG: hypothetical protein ABIZ34_02070, partial [Candidatus Limnocylindrales bacterium]